MSSSVVSATGAEDTRRPEPAPQMGLVALMQQPRRRLPVRFVGSGPDAMRAARATVRMAWPPGFEVARI